MGNKLTKKRSAERPPTIQRGEGGQLVSQLGSLAHREYIKAATSDNTRRSYQSSIRHFQQWGGLLPCPASMVSEYLLAHSSSLSVRTLLTRLTALKNWHLLQGFEDPVNAEVKKLMTGIERKEGKPEQKAPTFTMKELRIIVEHIEDDLKGLRDKALILTGFYGAFRRSELVALRVEDIRLHEKGIVITVPRSKTDQKGKGKQTALLDKEGALSPIDALNVWVEASGIESGPVFRAMNRWGTVHERPLLPASVSIILKSRSKRAGLVIAEELSAHSLRRSFATSASRAGSSFASIKRQGNWETDATVQGYIDEADLFESNAMDALD